jgi:phosphotriesterase-related protein
MKKIRTVCGDIKPEQLGMTSMHEHTLYDLRGLALKFKDLLPPVPEETTTFTLENLSFLRNGGSYYSLESACMADVDYMSKELGYFKALGGVSICDCSPSCLRGNISEIKNISEQSGVNIVCSSGLYTAMSRPDSYLDMSESQMAELFEKEVTVGIDGTDIKAGILKCAIEGLNAAEDDLHPLELASVRACAKVAAKTGMPIQIHSAIPVSPPLILKTAYMVLDEFGVSPDKLLMCHMDRYLIADLQIFDYVMNFDSFRILSHELQDQLLKMGCSIGVDTWGIPMANPTHLIQDDYDRLKFFYYLLDKGYSSQVVLGHDAIGKISSKQFGGFGMTRWPEYAIGMMRQLGIEEEDINNVIVNNPARILAF